MRTGRDSIPPAISRYVPSRRTAEKSRRNVERQDANEPVACARPECTRRLRASRTSKVEKLVESSEQMTATFGASGRYPTWLVRMKLLLSAATAAAKRSERIR